MVDFGGPNTVLLFGFLHESSCFLHFGKSIPRETLLLMLQHCGLFLSKIVNMIDYKDIKKLKCFVLQFLAICPTFEMLTDING